MKKLCVYFSLNNHVREIAKGLKDVDLLEIETVKKLPKNKMWQMIYLGGLVSRNKSLEIKAVNINYDEYSDIIIATPVWAGKLALPLTAFLETYTFKNKKVKLLISCAGNGGNQIKEQVEGLLDASNEIINVETFTRN